MEAMGEYQLGLYEKAMPGHLAWEEKLRTAKDSGFDFLEISIDESDQKLARLDMGGEEFRQMAQAMEQTGFDIRTMCLSGHRKYPIGSHEAQIRERGMEIMESAIALAYKLGIRIIQLAGYDVYYEKSDAFTKKMFQANLARCAELAAKSGIVLAFETMETEFMNTVEKSMKYIRRIQSPYLNIYPDIGNLTNAAVLYGTDVLADIRKGKGRIAAAHLKETKPGVFREVPFGTGHTDFSACAAELYRQGVRIFTGEFWYTGSERWREDVDAAAIFLRAKMELAVGGNVMHALKGGRMQ